MAPSKRRRTIEDDGDSTDNGEEVVDVQPVRQRPKQKKSRLAQAQENGGSVVSDEDSLPDDTVYAERQSHQGAADPNDTEDEDLELEQEIRDEYVSRNADGRENQPADHGVIEEVYCENFMCHNKLRIKLGPLLNFIVGHNGSGKSAVLTALTICLGVKATATNRGGSLKKFIKEGCESAMIRVRIKNQGSQAYQPEVYGDSIVVERQFNKQGASNFKLKSAQDRIISTKRAELDDILDCLALQLDNPLNVLTQDLARQFLSSSTPTQKYGFFMKGTQLQQLDRDYREMARSIDETEAKLDNRTEDIAHLKRKVDQAAEKKKAMDSIDTLRDQIDKLTYQHAWAQVGDVESNVAQYQKEMDKAEERIRERKDNANAKSDAFSSMDANVEAAKQLKQDFEAEMQPLKEKQENVKKEFNIGTKKLSENLAMARSIKTDLRSAQVDKARAEAKLAEEEARMEAASGPAQAAKLAELKAAENDLKDAKEAQTSQESRQGLDRDRQTAQTKVITREEARNNAKEKVRDAERMLNNLRNKDDDRMKAFHHKMPSVLREIRNESRFRVKPVGPMGMHVQLKKPEWSLIVESIFGKSLESFVVTSAHDQTILRSILLKHGLPGDIFVGNARPLDITNQKAVTNDDTLLSILEIDNDLVRNQFIINQAIEQTVMIKKRSTASALMDSPNKPRNAKILICMHDTQHGEGHRFTMSASGKRIDRVSKWQGSIRMKTEMEGQIRNQQEAVTHAKRNEETAQQELRAAQQELEVAKQAVNRWERRAKELKLAKQTAEDDQERITEELKAFDIQAGSLDVFKVQITEAEESIALASNSYTDSVNEKDSINTAQRKIKAELDKADAAMEEMAIKLTKVDKSINRHVDTRMAALREKNLACKQVEDAEKQLQEWTTKKADEEEKLVEFTNMATQISPRVPVDRGMTVDKIDAKLERLKREQDAAEGAVGASREEIMERYVRAQEEYRNASNGLKLLEDTCKRLKMSYKLRNARWQEFRKYITARAMIMFAVLLNERGFKGRLICSHHTKQLDIAVEPDTTQTSDKGRQAKTLSGGEKSFATICLLLAIWEAMGSPIRCLDEFDVFMDPVNRETSMRMMIQAARRATGKQYILITPQNMGNVPVNGYTSIHKMSDPERGQTTIPYQ